MGRRKKSGTILKGDSVTFRLEPKLKWGIELLARKHKRTLSSVIEWSIFNALNSQDGLNNIIDGIDVNILELVWDVEQPDRIIKLAIYCPNLLSYEEEVIWKLIKENNFFWNTKTSDKNKYMDSLNFERIRDHWENLVNVATRKADKSILPKPNIFNE